jgi:serine/threonine protein kinase
MDTMIGQTVAQYQIQEKLGEGGMGVVYKARDTKLDRTVALKFLPERLSSSEQDKARFILEAKAASSLNHPNVCTIHDILDHDGRMFMVMEYIDGATLRTKVPVADEAAAIGYAVQIGDALAEAHAKGIVHRDIKADNIMVNAKNQVKVMDFGLAKLKGTMKLTRTSSTVGTLAYMAPEQISGGEVDARSDIFSFGVVLYEMLAGKTPFRGDHEAAMVYSIVNEEPEDIEKYRPGLPAELLHVLGRSLEKDPADRYQSVTEMVIDLRRLKKETTKVSRVMPSQRPSSSVAAAPAVTTPVPEQRAASSFPKVYIGIAAALIVIIGAAAYFLLPRGGTQVSAGAGGGAMLNPAMTLRVLQIPLSQISYPGLSADGNWISFPAGDRNGTWDMYYMHSSGNDPKRVTHDSATFSQQVSDISPDGSQIAYTQARRPGDPVTDDGRPMYIASSLGGDARKMADGVGLVRWRPDGQRLGMIMFHRQTKWYFEFWSMRPDGSDLHMEFADTIAAQGRFSFSWSPDGNSVAWIRSFSFGHQEIVTHELATGAERQLTNDKKNIDDVFWLRNGMILFSSNKSGNTNLWVVSEKGGEPVQITKGSGPDIGISASADAKKILYLQQQPVGTIWLASAGKPTAEQITFDDRDIQSIAISPDAKRIAFIMADPDPLKAGQQIYVQDVEGTNRKQLTTSDDLKSDIIWSPDGAWIGYAARGASQPFDSIAVMLLDANRPGMPKRIGPGTPTIWAATGGLKVIKPNETILQSLDITTGKMEKYFEDSTFAGPVLGGRSILYFDTHTGKRGLWLIKDQTKPAARTLLLKDGTFRVALPSESSLLYMDMDRKWWKLDLATGTRERSSYSLPGYSGNGPSAVNPDGTAYAYIIRKLSSRLVMIENAFQAQ